LTTLSMRFLFLQRPGLEWGVRDYDQPEADASDLGAERLAGTPRAGLQGWCR
jgi:hypothetical protein